MVVGATDEDVQARPPFMPPGKRGQFNESLSLLSISLFLQKACLNWSSAFLLAHFL